MVRLKDVAERAGVSVMTVSRVLRDTPEISAQTKARVRRIAEEMGYVPNAMAQSLRTRTTRLLGLVLPAADHPSTASTAAAVMSRAHELGYDLMIGHSLNDPEREEACIRKILARHADGLIVMPAYRLGPAARTYEEMRRLGTAAVLLGQSASFCEGFSNVESDDYGMSRALTRHLIELGHRKIALFTGPPAAPWSRLRRDGCHQALREAGLPDEDSLVFSAGQSIEDGRKAALQMLGEGVRATAICAATDAVAMGLAEVLLGQGLRIPEDISVAGFGNLPMSEHFRVPLTTAGQPHQRLGTEAVDLLMELLGGGQRKNKILSGEVIIRASTAPPPA